MRVVLRGFPPLCRFSRQSDSGGAACRLEKLGDVRGVLGVLRIVLVVPIVHRVLVSW